MLSESEQEKKDLIFGPGEDGKKLFDDCYNLFRFLLLAQKDEKGSLE